MNWIFAKLRGWARRPLSEGEKSVLAVLFDGEDPRLGKLLLQIRTAPELMRTIVNQQTYRLGLEFVTDDSYLVELDSDAHSRRLRVVADDDRELQFLAVILRSGFFGYLEGTVESGMWPKEWRVKEILDKGPFWDLKPSYEEVVRGVETSTRLLEQWLGVKLPRGVRATQGATENQLQAMSARLGQNVPKSFLDLLAISNGLRIGRLDLYGTEDAYIVREGLIGPILVIANMGNDGIIGCSLDDGSAVVSIRPDAKVSTTLLAPDVRAFIRLAVDGFD